MNPRDFLQLQSRAIGACLIATSLLVGCGNSDQAVQQRMAAVSKNLTGMVEKIAEPKGFAPYKYESATRIDPFSEVKLALANQLPNARNPLTPHPEPHAPQPLEAFPLESLKMVGMLQQKGATYAFVKSDAAVQRIQVGDYMGKDNGKVTAINESQIALTELVRDGGGDYVARSSTLQLQQEKR